LRNLFYPLECRDEVQESRETRGDFIKAREQPSVMFEKSEGALDFVPLLVQFGIVFPLYLAVGFRRDDRSGSGIFHMGENGIGIVSFIGEKCLKLQSLDKRNRLLAVGFLPARQNKSKRIAERVAHAMNLRGKPATGAS